MKQWRTLMLMAAILALLAALASACSGKADNGADETEEGTTTKTVIDHAGHEVAVPANPQRVVAPFLEDHLAVLGVEPVAQFLYGNLEQNYLQDRIPGAEIIDITGSGVSPEKLVELSPGLIILGAGLSDEKIYEQYAKIAPTYVVNNVHTRWQDTLLEIARLLGKEQQAEEQLEAYNQEVQQARAQLEQQAANKTAAVVVLSDKEFYTMGHVQGAAVLFGELGVQPHRLTPAEEEWNTLSLEQMSELDADYLFVIKTERYAISELEKNSLWTNLPAVQGGRVFDVESGIWQYSGMISSQLALADIKAAILK